MEELRLSARDKQDARMALLRYYSSECVAHGAYLVALAVAFLGFVEFTPYILDFVSGVVFPVLSGEVLAVVVLSLVASVFVVLFVYVFGRVVVWGYLASAVLGVRPKGGSGVVYDGEGTTVTFLLQLHEGCLDYVRGRHGFWGRFLGLRARFLVLVWFDLFVLFVFVSVLFLFL